MLLQTEHVFKQYGDYTALSDVSVSVPRQSIFGLLGPNGAGKTTLIRIINQITAPDSGSIIFDGKPMQRSDVYRIGYLPEERGLYRKMKVGEQALYLARLKGLSAQDAKKRLTIWFERFEMQTWWNKKVEDLSKGMAQKVQFVTTVLHEPELLILDEPFSGFDPINAGMVKSEILRLRDAGATIILSTHNMSSVEEICDRIALIHKSQKVLEGGVKELRNRYKSNTFILTFKGDMISFANALWSHYELTDKHSEDGIHTVTIKLGESKRLNDLLGAILPVCEVISAIEKIPGMNDIFLEAVQAEHHQYVDNE
jgi:ABC-2 type transport system ATP-binding protein